MITDDIEMLILYGLQKDLIEKEDEIFVRNRLLALLHLDAYPDTKCEAAQIDDLSAILLRMIQYAASIGMVEEDRQDSRDNFDTQIMSLLVPRPSEVISKFWRAYKDNPQKATDFFYKLSCDSDYIRRYRIQKDIKWITKTDYGNLDITINLSKPEKDPRSIAAQKLVKATGYPKCLLCRENEGYEGRSDHPARGNLRLIPLTLNKEEWYMQYSPYVYYNEHCIVLSKEHKPMRICHDTFCALLDFVKQFPHYTIGSNADLPIVGGSILSHEHYQGGHYEFPMARAKIDYPFSVKGFGDVEAGIVKWPMSVLRLKAEKTERLIELADFILDKWRMYSNEKADIFAETEGISHNTITPIARRRGEDFELDLVLRNNITTPGHPLGLFHPHENLHHIKKENIGLIEVMGLAVLPSRLSHEMELVEKAVLQGKSLRQDPVLEKHAPWAEDIISRHNLTEENITDVFRQEIGLVFLQVLTDSGVFKHTREGHEAFCDFLSTLSMEIIEE